MDYVTYKGEKFETVNGILDLSNKGIESISEIIGLDSQIELRELILNNKIKKIEGLESLTWKSIEVTAVFSSACTISKRTTEQQIIPLYF